MPPKIQKGVAATILSFLGSSLVLGIVIFFIKDTVDKVNETIDRVNKTQVSIQKFESTATHLGEKLSSLNKVVDRSTSVLENYVRVHGKNLSNMTTSMVRITDKLVDIESKCNEDDKLQEACKEHLIIYEHERKNDAKD